MALWIQMALSKRKKKANLWGVAFILFFNELLNYFDFKTIWGL